MDLDSDPVRKERGCTLIFMILLVNFWSSDRNTQLLPGSILNTEIELKTCKKTHTRTALFSGAIVKSGCLGK